MIVLKRLLKYVFGHRRPTVRRMVALSSVYRRRLNVAHPHRVARMAICPTISKPLALHSTAPSLAEIPEICCESKITLNEFQLSPLKTEPSSTDRRRSNPLILDSTEPPLAKIPRCCVELSDIKLFPSSHEKFTDCVRAKPLHLLDLPDDLLQQILSYVNIWHHNRIRGTSRRMRDMDDAYLMHVFNKTLNRHQHLDAHSYESAALRVIQHATDVYVRSGYESIFCGCILPLLRSAYRDPFCPSISLINRFLLHFYDRVNRRIGDSCSQYSRLLYNLTLMRFFKQFDKANIISSRSMPLHWRIEVELHGPWLGMLWPVKMRMRERVEKRSNLLAILAEMMLANITGRSFKRVWECLNEIYVFGNDTTLGNRRVPRTLFTFTVHGSKKICSLFSSCLENDCGRFEWPKKWPRDQFTVNLHISCREAMKWGCSRSQHMEFGPFAERLYSDDEEEEETRRGRSLPDECEEDNAYLSNNCNSLNFFYNR